MPLCRPDTFYKRTALHTAAQHGKVEAVKMLLDSGADANFPDIYGWLDLFTFFLLTVLGA